MCSSALLKNLVEHGLDLVAGVPVAMVIETARLLEDTGKFNATWAH
jgi:hypothetical protein